MYVVNGTLTGNNNNSPQRSLSAVIKLSFSMISFKAGIGFSVGKPVSLLLEANGTLSSVVRALLYIADI